MLLRRISTLLAVIVAVGTTEAIAPHNLLLNPAVAQTSPNNKQHRPNPGQGNLVKELNLSPQQVEKLKKIPRPSKEQIMQKVQTIRQAQQDIGKMMGGNASREQVRNKYNQINALKQQLADADFDNTLAIREVLTPQQRQKFVELLKGHH